MVLAAATGLGFGAVATLLNAPPGGDVLDGGLVRTASLVVNSGAAWAGVGVLGGWLLGSTRRGLVGGPVALVAAVVAYYLLGAVVGSENPDGSIGQIGFFSLMALVTGCGLGVAGGLIRRPDVLGLLAALVVPLGVGAEHLWRRATVLTPPDPARPTAEAVLFLLALAGVGVAVARFLRARRSRARSLGQRESA